tara:strand:+ start:54 stop:248 length:195 start_codon:yes stop_codon:yes gene_type:complete
MTDAEFKEFEDLAKDIEPEFKDLIKSTGEEKIEIKPGVFAVYNPDAGGWTYTDPDTGEEAIAII